MRENLIPEGKTLDDVLNGRIGENDEESIMTAKKNQQMYNTQSSKPTIEFTDGIVFSNKYIYWDGIDE